MCKQIYILMLATMENVADPDEFAASHLDQHCLLI